MQIESNTNYEKKKWSKVVRDDIREGTARSQRRIYIHLPSSQDHQHLQIFKVSYVCVLVNVHVCMKEIIFVYLFYLALHYVVCFSGTRRDASLSHL